MSKKPKAAAAQVLTLADLTKQLHEPVNVELVMGENKYMAIGRRTTPEEDRLLDLIEGSIVPPIIRGKTMEEDRPDYSNVKYLTDKANAANKTRAVAVYWCFPEIAAMRPDLKSYDDIQRFVNAESGLNSTVLNLLFMACKNPGVTIGSLVNFSSAGTSASS